jgi:type VI secretion system protein ImpE
MEEAKKLLDAGDLDGAIQAALSYVKTKPLDHQARTFLFELSLFSGDWERAERQLDAIGHQDANAMIGALIYRQCIDAERKRAKYFSEGLKPEFLSDPPNYVYGLLTANNRVREGKIAEAKEILDQTEEERPAFPCTVNGEQAEDFRDYNDLTSGIMEVIIKDSYVWVPFEQIEKITINEPQSLRDLFWLQGTMETANGTNGEVFFPMLYVNSYKHADDQARLGRMTDWRDLGDDLFAGEGTKLFFVNGQDRPITELKEVVFTAAD